jgi:hypothetical protein
MEDSEEFEVDAQTMKTKRTCRRLNGLDAIGLGCNKAPLRDGYM